MVSPFRSPSVCGTPDRLPISYFCRARRRSAIGRERNDRYWDRPHDSCRSAFGKRLNILIRSESKVSCHAEHDIRIETPLKPPEEAECLFGNIPRSRRHLQFQLMHSETEYSFLLGCDHNRMRRPRNVPQFGTQSKHLMLHALLGGNVRWSGGSGMAAFEIVPADRRRPILARLADIS